MEMFVNFLFYLILLFTELSQLIKAEDCVKQSSCSCLVKSSNFLFDLKPLSSPGNPRLTATGGGFEYIFNPCDAITTCVPKVGDISVCQKAAGTGTPYCAGTESSATFQGDLAAGTLSLKFECMTVIKRTTIILITCGNEEKLTFVKDISPVPPTEGIYELKLSTQYACIKGPPSPSSGGLSTGSTLLLIFFILLLVYLIGGILFMKFARGASGIEMVPNLEFWKEIPSLIKDGIVFVSKGCKSDTTYSQI